MIGLIGLVLFYFWGVGNPNFPLTGDQKFYSSIALEMWERSEWLIPYFLGEPNFYKPPLQYVSQILGWKIFGFGILGPMVFQKIQGLLFVWILSLFFDLKKNKEAVFLLAMGSIGFVLFSSVLQMEMALSLFWAAAILSYLKNHATGLVVSLTLLSWVKGPLYPCLFVLSVGMEFLVKRELPKFLKKKIWVFLLAAVLSLSWFFYAAIKETEPFWNQFVRQENMGKVVTAQGSLLSLWGTGIVFLLPSIFVFLFVRLSSVGVQKARDTYHQLKYFLWIPAVFFTLFPYRVSTYLWLLSPVGFWIAASLLSDCEVRKKRVGFALALQLMVLGVSIVLWQNGWVGSFTLGVLLCAIGCAVYAMIQSNLTSLQVSFVLLLGALFFIPQHLIQPEFQSYQSFIQREAQSSRQWVLAQSGRNIWSEFGMLSMWAGRRITPVMGEESWAQVIELPLVWIVPDEEYDRFKDFDLNCQAWSRFQKKGKLPWAEILTGKVRPTDSRFQRIFQICEKKSSSDS